MKGLVDREEDLIFSLDIGTKTIIGIVGQYAKDGKFNILAYSIQEHNKRNMYDGQIHDIDGVTNLVLEIKRDLENQLGTSLKKVSIAAAGRALKTCKLKVDKEIDGSEITKSMVELLELEGVQRAQETVNNDESYRELKYYNIGYSIINYYLDNNVMMKLEGHRGEKIGVELLATFLPQVVIEGLYSVISKAGLEVLNITLEPIAAIKVAIKEELRLLNLALVDIGAGTSDIAITKDGTITAYAMTSKAGDEITEALSKKYLLDFNAGEKLKTKLSSQDEHEFLDILGVKHRLTTEEIVDSIYEIIAKITTEIADKIIEFNGKAPDAVFLIGGSSQMPRMKECLAEKLGLSMERVSIRDTSFIENVNGINNKISGPDIVTPIGIAIEGATQKYKNFLQIDFNNEEVRIFNTDRVKVSDILVLTGYNPRNLLPESGEDFIYFLNGEEKVVRGTEGQPAIIYINDEIGNLKTPLQNRDKVRVIKGSKGEKIIPYLYDCIPERKMINFNNEEFNLIQEIRINNDKVLHNSTLVEGDRIDVYEIKRIGDLLKTLGLNIPIENILINGEKAEEDRLLKENDVIITNQNKIINLIINGEEKKIGYSKKEFLFVDIFDHIDFDLTKPKGNLILRINGKEAEYMAPLKEMDEIEIYWNK